MTNAVLKSALDAHRAGQLAEARLGYEKVLTADPSNLDALHGIGLIVMDLGAAAKALPLLTQCVNAAPEQPLYRASLGLALVKAGKPEAALPHLHKAAAVFANSLEIWAAKGAAERKLERHAEAEGSFRCALALAPKDVEILNNLGVVVRAQGRLDEAASLYTQVITLQPNHAIAHNNLGNVLDLLNRTATAEYHLRQAVELDPAFIDARYNLAAHLTRNERPEEAIPHFEAVIAALPERWDAWTNLGVARLAIGDVDGAITCYRRSLALKSGNAEAHYDLAWALLLSGQWDEGWREYEWRWELPNFSSRKRTFAKPRWTGTPLPEGTLLLHAEQGLGDAIQFVRYAAMAKPRVKRVIVECPKPLTRLFTGLAGIDEVIAAGAPLPPFDAEAPFMSLPRVFNTSPDTAPAARSYIAAPRDIPDHLKLPDNKKPRIGLVWAGSPDNKIDRQRTIPARMLTPIASAIAADIVSLQVGVRADEASGLKNVIFACDGQVKDFTDTAAVVSQLDVVIGVDTAVMHLAAAMGKPTWILLPFMPDYRWLLGREDTPWYPSVRLFRQKARSDWNEVINRAAAALTFWQRPRV